MKRMKIGLVGYYGYGNYGDELFLDVFRKYFHDCDLSVLSPNGTNPVYPQNIDTVDSLDCIIIGGGDLIIPKYFPFDYFDDRLLAKPIYMHGTGVPLWIGEDEDVVARLATFFQHPNIKKINVRDIESAAWVNTKLKPKVAADYSPDMVFALDLPRMDRDPQRKVFGLIMRKLLPGEANWPNIKALLDRARGYGYEIRTIVLGTDQTRLDDLETLKELDYPEMTIVDPNDLAKLTKAIGACDVVGSTKFHGCVIATAYGVPAITLTKTDKFINLYRIIQRPDLLSHFVHDDVPERLPKYMAPISTLTRRGLRAEAIASMQRLRRKIMNELD